MMGNRHADRPGIYCNMALEKKSTCITMYACFSLVHNIIICLLQGMRLYICMQVEITIAECICSLWSSSPAAMQKQEVGGIPMLHRLDHFLSTAAI